MSKLRSFLWILAAVVFSVVMMHILFIRKYNMRDAAIHIVQSLKVNVNKELKEQSDIDPHGNNGQLKVEEVVPEVVRVEEKPSRPNNSVTNDDSKAGKPTEIVKQPVTVDEKPGVKKEESNTQGPTSDGQGHDGIKSNTKFCSKGDKLGETFICGCLELLAIYLFVQYLIHVSK